MQSGGLARADCLHGSDYQYTGHFALCKMLIFHCYLYFLRMPFRAKVCRASGKNGPLHRYHSVLFERGGAGAKVILPLYRARRIAGIFRLKVKGVSAFHALDFSADRACPCQIFLGAAAAACPKDAFCGMVLKIDRFSPAFLKKALPRLFLGCGESVKRPV